MQSQLSPSYHTFGQFVRVLVDMDLTQTLHYKVHVERIGFTFFVESYYENLLAYCSNYRIIGHHVEVCKKFNSNDENATITYPKETRNQPKEARKSYVRKKDNRMKKRRVRIAKNIDEIGVKVANNIEEVDIIENQPKAMAQKQIKKSPSTKNKDVGSKTQPVVRHNSFEALIDKDDGVDQSLKQQEDNQQVEVTVHPPKPMSLKAIIWQSPPLQWIKCNTNGASTPTAYACGGIFRNSNADFLCVFASKTDMVSAFSV
jgi:recombination DNA repair RAD52 pathway protein